VKEGVIGKLIPLLPRFLRRHRLIKLWLWITKENPVQLVRFFRDNEALLDLRDGFLRLIPIEDDYDDEFFKISEPFLRRKGHYFDVGANFGLTSFGLCDIHMNSNVIFHLFEANPDLIPILNQSMELYPDHHFNIEHACISDQMGVSRLARRIEHTGAAHVSPKGDVEVKNLCLDDYVIDNEIESIPLAKFDIEGHELHAFRGFQQSMRQGTVEAIILEVAPEWLERQGGGVAETLNFLAQTGYYCFFFREGDPNISSEKSILVDVNGQLIKLWPLEDQKINSQTDILALHRNSYGSELKKSYGDPTH